MARAKTYLLVGVCVAAAGCAGGLKRLAPPGIVKYEDLAKGQPINPVIAAAIEGDKDEKGKAPELSTQPTKPPKGIDPPERNAIAANLETERDALNAAVTEDQAAAAAERDSNLEDLRDALAGEIEKDDKAARRERGRPSKATPSMSDPNQ